MKGDYWRGGCCCQVRGVGCLVHDIGCGEGRIGLWLSVGELLFLAGLLQ